MTSGPPSATAPLSRLAAAAGMAVLLAVSARPAAAQETADDPRIPLVDLQREGRFDAALEETERWLTERAETAHRLGFDVLAGDLLDRAHRERDAATAFVHAIEHSPDLALYARYRAARAQEELGHPEVAAGLVATVVAARRPEAELPEAVSLLRRAVLAGGDCRLLGGLEAQRYADAERRRLLLTIADCALRLGETGRAMDLYAELMDETVTDETAREAAERVAALAGDRPPDDTARRLGQVYYQHRDFDRAIHYLGPLVASFTGPLSGDRFELAYQLVRSRFWQEHFAQAAAGFAALAARAGDPELVARALYQQARCHELTGDWAEADNTFRRVYRSDPDGRLADAALIGALRLEWRSGRQEAAAALFELLAARRQWTAIAARAGLFLAASDLVSGRADRAGHWLDVAARGGRDTDLEVAYWRGRKAELEGDLVEAARRYVRVERLDFYHPLALDARDRMARGPLAPVAQELAARQGTSASERYDAWLLLASQPEPRSHAAAELARRLARDPGSERFLTLSAVPTGDWPLWRADLDDPAEELLALGLWAPGVPALREHFPYDRPDLAFTAGWLLARGGHLPQGMAIAETLARQIPDGVPEPFWPYDLRRLLYPFAFAQTIFEQSARHHVDPYLLVAIIREESRFDARALSAASARGLTQFVQPTAETVASAVGLGDIGPHDLYRPTVSISLGAAYVARLLRELGGDEQPAVAAYNAGPAAARLWRSYCYSDEPAEYFSKISYGETRGYVRKVLGSWARYREIYGAPDGER